MDLAEVSKFETKVGVIKLSEAIRAGIKLRPKQCFNDFYQDGASCALGAAWEGSGRRPEWLGVSTMPVAKAFGTTVYRLGQVALWNDSGITREEIADRLQAQGL